METALKQKVVAAVVLLLCWTLWVFSMRPAFYYLDAGIYVAAATQPGIPYPPGFPSYMVPAFLFRVLPIGDIAQRLHLFSMTSALITCLLMYLTIGNLAPLLVRGLTSPSPGRGRRNHPMQFLKPDQVSAGAEIIARFIPWFAGWAVLMFGTSILYWSQAVNAEVYSYHLLFCSALIYLLLRVEAIGRADKRASRLVYAVAVTTGLSLANHPMASGLLVLTVLWLALLQRMQPRIRYPNRTWLTVSFLILITGLLPYLYLPLRSIVNADPDWGNPESLGQFLRVMTGISYTGSTKSFDWFGEACQKRLLEAGWLLYRQFCIPGIVLALIGLRFLWLRTKRITAALSVFVILSILLGAVYIQTKENACWYLPAYYVIALWMSLGLVGSALRLPNLVGRFFLRTCLQRSLISLLVLALAYWGLLLYQNRFMFAEANNFIVRDYGVNLLERLEPNSLLFLTGDNPSSALLALQTAERFRDDVVVLHQDFLGAIWYRDNLEARKMINLPQPLQSQSQGRLPEDYLIDLIRANPTRAVYFLKPDSVGLLHRLPLEPYGMLYKLLRRREDQTPPQSAWTFRVHDPQWFTCYPRDPQPIIQDGFEEICLGFFRAYLFGLNQFVFRNPELAAGYGRQSLSILSGVRRKQFHPTEVYVGMYSALLQARNPSAAQEYLQDLDQNKDESLAMLMEKQWFTSLAAYSYEVLRTQPEDNNALEYLAVAMVAMKRYADAEQTLNRLIAIAPHRASALYNLGNVMAQTGRPEAAIRAYEQALKVDNGFELARAELAKIKQSP